MRNFQSRLGAKLDKIKRKLIDNQISFMGNTLDFLRVKVKLTKQGDIESRIVEEVGLIEAVMPPLIDIPMRRIIADDGILTIDSFDANEIFPFDIYVPMKYNLDRDELLFRVIYPDVQTNRAYCMVLQIKDTFATIGGSSPLWKKFTATYYDQGLPSDILVIVMQAQTRRETLGW